MAVLSAGLLARGIRIASDGEAFIILKRLDRESLQSPVIKKCAGFFPCDTGALTQSILRYRCSQNNVISGKNFQVTNEQLQAMIQNRFY